MSYTTRLDTYGYTDVSRSYNYSATDDWTTPEVVIPGVVGETIFIQRIFIAVLTSHAATQTFQDTGTVPTPAAMLVTNAPVGPVIFDFGPDGYALPQGAGLAQVMSGVGGAGAVVITAYRRETAVQPS
jgi:hypothetical protein